MTDREAIEKELAEELGIDIDRMFSVTYGWHTNKQLWDALVKERERVHQLEAEARGAGMTEKQPSPDVQEAWERAQQMEVAVQTAEQYARQRVRDVLEEVLDIVSDPYGYRVKCYRYDYPVAVADKIADALHQRFKEEMR